MSQDSGERSEKATAQRMKEVHSKGKMTRSQDLAAWLGIGAAAVMLPGVITRGREAASESLYLLDGIALDPQPGTLLTVLGDGMSTLGFILGPLFAVVLVVVVATAAIQGGIRFRTFKLDPANLNLLTGVQRVFGFQALWQGIKALLKVVVIGLVLWFVIASLMPLLLQSGSLPLSSLLSASSEGTASLIRASVIAGLVLAAADVFMVQRRNRKHTRMTRKEVTDENKRSEGDPLIKSQRRARAMDMSRNRMIAAVADADVVIINPTHVAVALRYQRGVAAPKVVARGADHVATRIREEAADKKVPMVRDIPLARSLHSECQLGDEIPVECYNDVARVLAFVMSLKARGASTGVHASPNPRSSTAARDHGRNQS